MSKKMPEDQVSFKKETLLNNKKFLNTEKLGEFQILTLKLVLL